jgi:hypothetical protein
MTLSEAGTKTNTRHYNMACSSNFTLERSNNQDQEEVECLADFTWMCHDIIMWKD